MNTPQSAGRRRDFITWLQAGLLGLSVALGLTVAVLGATSAARAQAPVPATQGGQGAPGDPGPPPPFMRSIPMNEEQQVVDQFDKNKDDRLDAAERSAAREWLASNRPGRMGFGGRAGRGGRGGRGLEPSAPGRKLTPADVRTYGSEPLYDINTIRTVFLQFENADWEAELAAFNNT